MKASSKAPGTWYGTKKLYDGSDCKSRWPGTGAERSPVFIVCARDKRKGAPHVVCDRPGWSAGRSLAMPRGRAGDGRHGAAVGAAWGHGEPRALTVYCGDVSRRRRPLAPIARAAGLRRAPRSAAPQGA